MCRDAIWVPWSCSNKNVAAGVRAGVQVILHAQYLWFWVCRAVARIEHNGSMRATRDLPQTALATNFHKTNDAVLFKIIVAEWYGVLAGYFRRVD